jgi:antitoxin ParD1/3/4
MEQISLSPEIEQIVKDKLATGSYLSDNEIVNEDVRLLPVCGRRLDELRRQVQIGRDQLDRGEYAEFDEAGLEQFFDELKKRGFLRYAERRPT